jgi:2-oxo-4-hydroxy-4-carboxy-5-ureidoimidazoline decarboxylase
MSGARVTLAALNAGGRQEFLSACGPLFEGSPWVADRAWTARPFRSLEALHRQMVTAAQDASLEEKLALIRAHPDLVGRLSARAPALGGHSAREKAAAGLDSVTDEEAGIFRSYNEKYHEKFGFPFVICARENRKEAILQAFPRRLDQAREREIETALAEIAKIAWLRLQDTISEE